MKPRVLLALGALALAACPEHDEADPAELDAAAPAAEAVQSDAEAAQPSRGDAAPNGPEDAGGGHAPVEPLDAEAAAARDAELEAAAPAPQDASSSPDALASGRDAEFVPTGKLPVFVAVGHMGRTTLSCDDGKSWIHDKSLDDGARCFENGLDCDHTRGAGRGLAYGNGQFVAAFGWGEPGQLKRSRDGVTWELARDKTIFAGVAFGHGVFVANATRPLISSDALVWHEAKSELGLNVWNTRGIDWIAPGGGRFLVTGESETTDLVLSKDDGESWSHAGTPPPKECGAWTRGAAHNATTVVLASGKGWVCTSTDGGERWELVRLDADNLSGPVLWTGAEFMTWNRSDLHRSRDGKVWTKQKVSPANISIGPVARGPHGTFVATNDGWQAWYEKQQFFRSSDGISWEVLDKSRFHGSHPITLLRFGYADAATLNCP
ncbi:MAG TPA: hypothetical protein VFZ61_03985 [Polyangiales bacterium]